MSVLPFDPIVAPSPGTNLRPEVLLNEVPFGDGYTLQSPNGLNHIRHTLSLKWEGLTQTEHDSLKAFFIERAGYKLFTYTHPGDGVPRKWTCKSWSSELGVPLKFRAELVENFSLTT